MMSTKMKLVVEKRSPTKKMERGETYVGITNKEKALRPAKMMERL